MTGDWSPEHDRDVGWFSDRKSYLSDTRRCSGSASDATSRLENVDTTSLTVRSCNDPRPSSSRQSENLPSCEVEHINNKTWRSGDFVRMVN